MNYGELSLKAHEQSKGKVSISSKMSVETKDELSIAYTPGVAEPCKQIASNKENAYKYTAKGNLVAVVTDGSAVLGLGNIGALAGMPVMEGKSILFKRFGQVDAFPICLDTQDIEEIISTVKNIAPGFGGINLEDIKAPKCFEIEKRLQDMLDIPVFHDDQHGTAIVVSAGIINGLRLLNKKIEDVNIVLNGTGAAGTAIIKMLISLGAKNIIACDSTGILYMGRAGCVDGYKLELAQTTNKDNRKGDLKEAVKGADIFIGVSQGNVLTKDMVKTMNKDSMVFAMANPIPEIMPDIAKEAGVMVMGTGRSDFPNQINNSLVFPGLFRGALDARAKKITEKMKIAAAYALADIILPEELNADYIIPDPFNTRVPIEIAKAVHDAWIE